MRFPVIDLDSYFARIRYTGPREPTLATLHALSAAQVQAIPFENLDVLLGRRILLDPESLFRKLVVERRGGYCFELNGLFLLVLEALGFRVTPIGARVRLDRPRDFTPPRTHVFVRVEIDGESWLADVGVGGLALTSAIRLEADGEQPTPHEPRRIVREGTKLFHQVHLGEEWSDICEFTLEAMPLIDREVANWFTNMHPQSHFRDRLLVARAAPDGGRHGLLNRTLTTRKRGGSADKRTIASPTELLAVLAEYFGLHFPAGTTFECPALAW